MNHALRYAPPPIFQSTKSENILQLIQKPEEYVDLVYLSAVSRYVVVSGSCFDRLRAR